MIKPTARSKTIARAAFAAFGGPAAVDRYWDGRHESSVDLVSRPESPWPGVTSYATVGVSLVPLLKDGVDIGVRTELVGACRTEFGEFANCLSTAAFEVINSRRFVAPGIVFLALWPCTGTPR